MRTNIKPNMKFKLYITLSIAILVSMGCNRDEKGDDNGGAIPMRFYAHIEGSDTKTFMGDEKSNGARPVLWDKGDSVGIYDSKSQSYIPFENTSESGPMATLDGQIAEVSNYIAFYPYNMLDQQNILWYWYDINIVLPNVQTYRENSFDKNYFPMVSYKSNEDEFFTFMNLCGVLSIPIVGEESVRSISFSGFNESGEPIQVAGAAVVNYNSSSPTETQIRYRGYEEYSFNKSKHQITLITPDGGVPLNMSTPTYFNIVLPPNTYHTFEVIVVMTNGKVMTKKGVNPLVISKSEYKTTQTLHFDGVTPTYLGGDGTANSYIAPPSGVYSIDVGVIGNGSEGIVPNVGFHTTDPNISPASVEVIATGDILSEDGTYLVRDHGKRVVDIVDYNSQYQLLTFRTLDRAGNVLLAAKDSEGNIIWSWHIWVTNLPSDHIYYNFSGATFTVMDRYLGAFNDVPIGGSATATKGLNYQWGRKDPYIEGVSETDWNSNSYTLSYLTNHPTKFPDSQANWFNGESSVYEHLWKVDKKTIYDPCPVGYRVVRQDALTGFLTVQKNTNRIEEIKVSGDYNEGYYFIYDGGGSVAWYTPSMWFADFGTLENYQSLQFYFRSSRVYLYDQKDRISSRYQVRCMRE